MSREITPDTSLHNLRKEAKRWLRALRANDPDARMRFERAYAEAPQVPGLRHVQHALAREYGQENWSHLKDRLAEPERADEPAILSLRSAVDYERLADDLVQAFDSQDEDALGRVNDFYRRTFSFDDLAAEIWRRVYSFRQRAFTGGPRTLHLPEAQVVIAQDAGFGSWSTLMNAIANGTPQVSPYAVEVHEGRISPRRMLSDREWDDVIAVMKEHRLSTLDAGGLMTDAVMARIARLDHVTALSLGGSRQLSDEGLLQLKNMPQLERLDLNEFPGGRLTDRGLEVLRYLPNLRTVEMTWQSGISDAGVAHLRFCDRLEHVNLMGSPTGDGAIEALQGKPHLRRFSTGRLVTDNGLPLLHNFPMLETWHGPQPTPDITGAPAGGALLLIDGPFTDTGLSGLAGLEGVFDLDLFWHVTQITSEGFRHLVTLPNLSSLGADGALSDDVSMRYMAAMPRLRRLRAQEAAATDEGFEALSHSRSLQFFWGRECPNFGSRGFVAFSRMPSLRGLGIGCNNVEDRALASLPSFPELRELTPIGVKDRGFRHVGRCEKLERLTCMYCRDTTDAATAHVRNLRLKYYYAGLTQITDRSLEILGAMSTLEQVDLYECQRLTDDGLVFLARLPNLREVNLDSLPGVSLDGTKVFPSHVRVRYTT